MLEQQQDKAGGDGRKEQGPWGAPELSLRTDGKRPRKLKALSSSG